MHAFLWIVSAMDWLIALAWLFQVAVWRRMIGSVPDLNLQSGHASALPLPRLSVIVPARNEAENIAATLESLLASHGLDLEIIAIDDRSDDGSGAIMEEMAREIGMPSKLRVLRVRDLPPRWLGKTHAMALAARHATGEWLLFTDADVVFHPDALRRALQFAVTNAADHLVLIPTVLLRSFGERMVIAFLQVVSIWGPRPWRVPDPRSRRDAIGVGAFNMIRREVYDAIGGWESLRMAVVEDLALGSRVKRLGFAQRVSVGRDLVRVRWARGAFGVVENLSKNLFALFSFRSVHLLGATLGLLLFTLFPLIAWLAGGVALGASAVMLLAILLAYTLMGPDQGFSAADMATFPLAAAIMFYALIRSMLMVLWRGGITWRGTFYSLRELRENLAGLNS
jgi:cellulose synthase/poly-beta-1,6-N-acetylglucosamine synthase-like glycosyltransferase